MAEPIRIREFGYTLPVHWIWVVLICALLAVCIFRTYLRERGNASRATRIALSTIRSLLCCLVVFSLMNWHVTVKKFRRSVLLVAMDNSTSLLHLDRLDPQNQFNDTSRDSKRFLPSRLNVMNWYFDQAGSQWMDNLRQDFSVQAIRVGSSVEEFDAESLFDLLPEMDSLDEESKLDTGISRLLKNGFQRPPAAILMFTDGVDSDDPQFNKIIRVARSLRVPVFPVGLGAKEPADDLRMVSVQCNPKVFLNDLVEFRMSVAADGFADQLVRLQLIDEDKQEIITEETIKISSKRYRQVHRFRVRMVEKGPRKFMARVLPIQAEFDTANNQKSVEVLVDGNPIKVLLAANYPSREFHFLKQFLGRESKPRPDSPSEFALNRIELSTFLQQADIEYTSVDRHAIKIFPVTRQQLFEFDVIIFCDLKPNWAGTVAGGLGTNELGHLKEFVEERGGGVIFVAGPKFTPAAYVNSSISHLFPLDLDSLNTPDPKSGDSEVFDRSYFIRRTNFGKRFLPMELGADNDSKDYQSLPGPFWFSASSKTSPSAVVLAELVLGTERLPAIVTQKVGLGTVLYHAFPESYRWRFRAGEVFFGRYWSQMIQFVASSKLTRGKESLVLDTDREKYFRNEPVEVFGQLLDQTLIGDNGISVTVKNLSGYERIYQLISSDQSPDIYSTTVENLGAGSYELFQTNNRQVATRFEVLDANRENQRRPINEAGLRRLTKETGGFYSSIDQLDDLPSKLPKRELIEIGSQPPRYFWNQWEVVAGFGSLFILLISIEWILRKKGSML